MSASRPAPTKFREDLELLAQLNAIQRVLDSADAQSASAILQAVRKAGSRAAGAAPAQAWLPDTFVERAYRVAHDPRRDWSNDSDVMISAFEASAIRQHISRPDLSGPQPPAEDIRNALQILQGADEYITDADSRFHGDGEGYRSLARPDHDDVVRLLRHALAQLEGSPLRAPQEDT